MITDNDESNISDFDFEMDHESHIESLRLCGFDCVEKRSILHVCRTDGSEFEGKYPLDKNFTASLVVEDYGDYKYGRGSDDGSREHELY